MRSARHHEVMEADQKASAGAVAFRVLLAVVAIGAIGGMLYLRSFPPMATVMSQSMEPTIKVGDVVLFKSLGGAPPEVGDIVEISVPADLQQRHGYPARVIHRVVGLNDDGTLATKGDNFENPDPFTTKIANVERKVVVTVPMAGRLVSFFFSPFGLLWIAIGVLVFVVMPFYDVQKERSELQQAEVASLAELQAKIDRATTWTVQADGHLTPYAAHGPPEDDQSYRAPYAEGAAPVAAEAPVVLADPEVKDRLEELVSAVGEYGYHLRSHTEILKLMSAASQDLAKVVADLQKTVAVQAAVATASPEPEPVAPVAARTVLSDLATRLQTYLTTIATPDWTVVNTADLAAQSRDVVTSHQVRAAMNELVAAGSIDLLPVELPHVFRYRLR